MASSVGPAPGLDPRASDWSHCLECVALSDVGMRRANNQDALSVTLASGDEGFLRRGHLLLVADGMGAHAAGELASKLAADNIPLSYLKYSTLPPSQALAQAALEANELIHRRAAISDDFRGMGTTATALALTAQGAIVVHVGDSRAYRVRGSLIEQLTFDHSLVWEMKAAGQVPNDQVSMYVPKNIITRSLGPNTEVQADLEGPFPLLVGDTFLLCTDGLSGQVQDTEIGALLYCLPVAKAVRSLVDLANLRGGPDNITVVAARITGPQVARGGGEANPGPATELSTIGPVLWGVAGVFLLAAVVVLMLGQYLPATVGLIAGALVGLLGYALRSAPRTRPIPAEKGSPLGRGPHTRSDAAPDAEFVDNLASTIGELREAAADFGVDWGPFNAAEARATAARQAGNLAEAVVAYTEAMTFMMDQLRRKAGRSG